MTKAGIWAAFSLSAAVFAAVVGCSAWAQPSGSSANPWGAGAGASARGDSAPPIEALVQAARAKSAKLTKAQRDANRQVFSNAFTLFQRGDFASARRGFELGLGVDPADAAGHYYLAETLVRLNEPAAAKEHYQMAMALSPGSLEGLQAATALEKVAVQQREREACKSRPAQLQDRGGGVLWQCSSGLEWTQYDNDLSIQWDEAKRWCAAMGVGWRLPTADELASLVDEREPGVKCDEGGRICKIDGSLRIRAEDFWSSDMKSSSEVWVVGLADRFRLAVHVTGERRPDFRVLCVRQSGSGDAVQRAPVQAMVEQQQQERARAACANRTQVQDRGNGVLWHCWSGLEWTQSDNGSNIDQDAARRWCAAKGEGWRLPTLGELFSLADNRLKGVKCGDDTCDVAPSFRLTGGMFWSSDKGAGLLGSSRTVNSGSDFDTMALCVRKPSGMVGVQPAAAQTKVDGQQERATCAGNPAGIEDRGGGVLRQCSSGLEWTQADNGSDINWNDARRWCAEKGGGWRLPTMDELGVIDSAMFRLTGNWFWSSEAKGSSQAWVFAKVDMDILDIRETEDLRALCVRRP